MTKQGFGRGLAALLGLQLSLQVFAAAVMPDVAREQKWAGEVVPGLVVGDPVYLKTASSAHPFLGLYTPTGDARRAVIVVHGLGIHPDWGMVGTLRTALADRGLATLSIQMPILAADVKSDAYPPLFPEAASRLAAAVAFLKSKGYTDLAIVSHSMGSRMSGVYMAKAPDPSVKAWASLGLSYGDYAGLTRPVLDLYGANDLPLVLENAAQRRSTLVAPTSRQRAIADADHFYTGHETAMVDAVAEFLQTNLK